MKLVFAPCHEVASCALTSDCLYISSILRSSIVERLYWAVFFYLVNKKKLPLRILYCGAAMFMGCLHVCGWLFQNHAEVMNQSEICVQSL